MNDTNAWCKSCGKQYSPPRTDCLLCYGCQPLVVDEHGAQLVLQLIELGCQQCKGSTFMLGIILEDGELMARCTNCRRPTRTGAKLTPERLRAAVDLRSEQMAASNIESN